MVLVLPVQVTQRAPTVAQLHMVARVPYLRTRLLGVMTMAACTAEWINKTNHLTVTRPMALVLATYSPVAGMVLRLLTAARLAELEICKVDLGECMGLSALFACFRHLLTYFNILPECPPEAAHTRVTECLIKECTTMRKSVSGIAVGLETLLHAF